MAHNLVLAASTDTTITMTKAMAAVIVVLVALGVFAIKEMKSTARFVAIVILVGILFVYVGFLHNLTVQFRGWLNGFLVEHGAPGLAGDTAFALFIALLAFLAYRRHVQTAKEKKDGDGSNTWMSISIILTMLLFTVTALSGVVVHITDGGAAILNALGQIPIGR